MGARLGSGGCGSAHGSLVSGVLPGPRVGQRPRRRRAPRLRDRRARRRRRLGRRRPGNSGCSASDPTMSQTVAGADTRNGILGLVGRYYTERHTPRPFDPDRDPVRYAGRVFGEEEMRLLVDASLDFYLTAGRFTEQFEAGVADYLGRSDALFVNSGSSANLVALTTLTSAK